MTSDNALQPIKTSLETPPRTTGNSERDLPILIDWLWRAYQVITSSVDFINSQTNNANFNVADLPDPSNTTLAQAQETANEAFALGSTAINRLDGFISGTFDISDADIGSLVTFTTPQVDANYRVMVQAVSSIGTPDVEAFVVKTKNYLANQFTVIMVSSPGLGNTITFEWQLIRND